MKHSIKIRLVLVLMALLSLTIIFCLILNKVFLEKYYERYKTERLGNTYEQVNKERLSEEDMESLSLKLEQLSSRQNVSMYVFNAYELSGEILLAIKYPLNMNSAQSELLQKEIMYYYYPETFKEEGGTEGRQKGIEIVKKKKYSILRHFDQRLETTYIELHGVLDTGESIFIRSNYSNITESVEIANNFFARMGVIAVILGSVIMYLVGASFTRPIRKLSRITKEISELNFDVEYDEDRQDEVGDLGKSINTLSSRLKVAVAELKSANNELKNDIKKKEKVDEMRKEFLSNVTHELKTPIALIQGYAEGLKDNINNDEESKNFYCDVIIDESAKMNTMVKKLLSLDQLEFGVNNPEFNRFDIMALLKSVVSSMDMIFKQKKACCEFEYNEPVYVWADEYLVEEVVTNYLSNALNHVEEDLNGNKIISIKTCDYDEKVRISIFNTGKPIPEEDIERIWDKFYKVDKARTREYGGSGIGLSIVRAIMKSHNRDYGVKNWDNGVEFWLEMDTKA